MLSTVLLICIIALYLGATAMVVSHIRGIANNSTQNQSLIFKSVWLGGLATLLHLGFAYQFSFQDGAMNFGLGSMSASISGLLCLIFLLGSLSLPIRRLGIIVFPLTAISLVFSQLWGNEFVAISNSSAASSAHIIVSVLAFCILAIASIQALLYVYQERKLKQHASPAVLLALPPLQTMEQLLFRLVWTGFILLTLTLVSGTLFSQQIYQQPLEFTHHIVLATLGWLVFATMLAKRHFSGLRGTQAVYWTIAGFLLIQLGYFGTKIVSESLAVQ